MTQFIVTANSYRPLVKDEKGKMVIGPRVSRGAIVDVEDDLAAPLVQTGGLRLYVEAEEVNEDDSPEGGVDDATGSVPADDTEDDKSEDENETNEDVPTAESLEAESYQDLQKLAKELTDNGGGSKAELIERILAHYADTK